MSSTIFVAQQYLIAGTNLLASLPAGCTVGYPSVLLQQLRSNDSSIQLDWDTASWIGSIHGLAGIPTILMPVFMQWKGRKLAFILACLVSIFAWILFYVASSATSILITEFIQGFGSQCILSASMFSLSEMLSPNRRIVSIASYVITDSLGIVIVQLLGSYLHWRTVSLVISAPLIVTALIATTWPESPAWLAYKGEFDKCAKAFTRLRGTGDLAQAELEELILAQKENLSRDKCKKRPLLKSIWQAYKRRDFYLPAIHIFVLLQTGYWSGCIAHLIYGPDIIQRATHSKDAIFIGNMIFNCSLFVCCIIATILIRFFQPKKVLLVCVTCAVIGLLCAAGVNYSQTVGWMSKQSYVCLYLLIGYMFAIAMLLPIVLPVASELMPVKHRGIAGPLNIIYTSLLHTTALKSVPYMLEHINLWGMLLVYAANATLCTLFIWKYVPETKGRTLQQLEDYYNYGNFDKSRRANRDKCLSELIAE